MHFLQSSLLLVASLSLVSALPSEAELETLRKTHRVVGEAVGPRPIGPMAIALDHMRHGVPVPNDVVKAVAAATQSGSVSGTTHLPYDQAYLYPVTVGENKLMLDFDTGSADLWVFSTKMPKAQQGTHHLYNPANSLGQDKGETWDISYVDGTGAKGIVYGDKVIIGQVTATVDAVEAATSVSSRFVTGYSDGLVGFAFDSDNTCSPYLCYTWFDQVVGTLPEPIFTVTLRAGKPGEFDFGYIDTTKYTGSIVYVPQNQNNGYGSWGFNAGGYAIGNGAKVSQAIGAIADTGTSLAYVDQDILTQYYKLVPGATYSSADGGYIFPCKNAAKLPNFSYYIGGQKRTMPGSYVNYAQIDSAGNCFGGLQSNSALGFSLIGDVFLKSQFLVYNPSAHTIGFAQQKGVVV